MDQNDQLLAFSPIVGTCIRVRKPLCYILLIFDYFEYTTFIINQDAFAEFRYVCDVIGAASVW